MAERKFQIKIEAAVSGKEDLDQLAVGVEDLAEKAGQAGPVSAALAEDLRALGDEKAAVATFEALAKASEELAEKQQAAQKTLADTEPTLQSVNGALKRMRTSYAEVSRETDALTRKEAEQKKTIAGLRDTISKAAAAKRDLRDRARELKQELTKAKKPSEDLKTAYANTGQEIQDLTRQQEKYRTQIKRLTPELQKTTAAKRDLQQWTKLVKKELAATERQARSLGKEYGQQKKQVRAFADEADRQSKRVRSAREEMDRLGIETKQLGKFQEFLTTRVENTTRATARYQKQLKDSGRAGAVAGQKIRSGLEDASKGASRLESRIGRTRKSLLTLGNAARGFVAAQFARLFVEANKATEGLQKGFEAVTGSQEQAAAEMEYARQTAAKLGAEVRTTSSAYLDLVAASKGTVLEGERTREIFIAIANAMGRLGKSSADTEGALTAIQQIISKGKVSSEELRGQLGERLPGAFQIAARAIGVTTAELDEMLKKGELMAEDLLPRFAAELEKTFDSSEKVSGFTASWNRLKSTMDNALTSANESTGVMNGLGHVMDFVAQSVNFVGVGFTTVIEKIKATTEATSAWLDFVSGDTKLLEFRDRVKDAFGSAEDAIADAADSAFALTDNLEKAGESGTHAGAKISAGMQQAKGEIIDVASEQGTAFRLMYSELEKLTKDSLPAYVAKLADLRVANLLTEEQYKVLILQVAALGETFQGLQNKINPVTQEIKQTGEKAETAEEQLARYKKELAESADSSEKMAAATKDTGKQIEQAEDAMAGAASIAQFMKKWIDDLRNSMKALSPAAEEMFLNLVTGGEFAEQQMDRTTAAIEATEQEILRLEKEVLAKSGFSDFFNKTALAAETVRLQFEKEALAAETMLRRIEDLDSATQLQTDSLQGSIDGFQLLDDQTLSHLQSEVERLTQANERMADSAENALRRYQDLIDQQSGNDVAIAQRKQAAELRDLEEQLAEAREANNFAVVQQLEQAIVLARRYYQEELARLDGRLAKEQMITRERDNQRLPLVPAGTPISRLPASPQRPVTGDIVDSVVPPNRLLSATADRDNEFIRAIKEGLSGFRPNVYMHVDGQVIARLTEPHLRRQGVSTESELRIAALTVGSRL